MTLDYCNFASGDGLGSMLIKTVAKGVMEHGNMLQRCPIRGHLYLKDYSVDLSDFPFAIPTGYYSLQICAYMHNKIGGGDLFLGNCISYGGIN